MTSAADPAARSPLRISPAAISLFAGAALAWVGVIAYSRHHGNGAGTMGMSLVTFVAMWSAMMTAMMLPAVAPLASLYVRTIKSVRAPRLGVFVAGYIGIWAAAGFPTYAILRLVDHATAHSSWAMRVIAAGLLAVAGAYQLTSLKQRCLRHCRSPLAQLLHYGNTKGRFRDFKISLHHGAYCLGCCWALMLLFIAFGFMNMWAMLGLAAVVVAEKILPLGESIGRVAGLLFLLLAVALGLSSRVATALVPSTSSGSMAGMKMDN